MLFCTGYFFLKYPRRKIKLELVTKKEINNGEERENSDRTFLMRMIYRKYCRELNSV